MKRTTAVKKEEPKQALKYAVLRGGAKDRASLDEKYEKYNPSVKQIGVDVGYAALAFAVFFGQNVYDSKTKHLVRNRRLFPVSAGTAINAMLGRMTLTKENSIDCEITDKDFIEHDGIHGNEWGYGWNHTDTSTDADIPVFDVEMSVGGRQMALF